MHWDRQRSSATGAGADLVDRAPGSRAETPLKGEAVDRPPSENLYVDGIRTSDEITLVLHGDVDEGSIPNLEAVLDGLVLLQPLRVVVDLSEVRTLSSSARQMIDTCGRRIIGGLRLRLPDSEAAAI